MSSPKDQWTQGQPIVAEGWNQYAQEIINWSKGKSQAAQIFKLIYIQSLFILCGLKVEVEKKKTWAKPNEMSKKKLKCDRHKPKMFVRQLQVRRE